MLEHGNLQKWWQTLSFGLVCLFLKFVSEIIILRKTSIFLNDFTVILRLYIKLFILMLVVLNWISLNFCGIVWYHHHPCMASCILILNSQQYFSSANYMSGYHPWVTQVWLLMPNSWANSYRLRMDDGMLYQVGKLNPVQALSTNVSEM